MTYLLLLCLRFFFRKQRYVGRRILRLLLKFCGFKGREYCPFVRIGKLRPGRPGPSEQPSAGMQRAMSLHSREGAEHTDKLGFLTHRTLHVFPAFS